MKKEYRVTDVCRSTNRAHSTISGLDKYGKIPAERNGTRWVIKGTKDEIIEAVNKNMKNSPHRKTVRSPRSAKKRNTMLHRFAQILDIPQKKWEKVERILSLPDETFNLIPPSAITITVIRDVHFFSSTGVCEYYD